MDSTSSPQDQEFPIIILRGLWMILNKLRMFELAVPAMK